MKKSEWSLENWRSWAEVGIKIFPYIKNKDTKSEVDGIEKILGIKSFKIKILDTCCGWGRHCLDLANRGYKNVYGIDISETFIEYAKNKNQQGVKFIQEDLMNLNFENKFDIVLNLWHSIGLYRSEEQNLNFFRKIYTLLKPLGRFIVDAANGDRDLQRMEHFYKNNCITSNRHWWYIKEKHLLGLTDVDFDVNEKKVQYRVFSYSEMEEPYLEKKYKWKQNDYNINGAGFFYENDYIPGNKYWFYNGKKLLLSEIKKLSDKKKNIKYQIYEDSVYTRSKPLSTKKIPLRIYTKAELIDLLKLAGFKICNVYGDFQMNKYLISSPRLIIVAQKKY